MEKTVYLDHASTTPLDSEVLKKMTPYLTEYFGNANSLHSIGRHAICALDDSRDTVARLIGAKPSEIYFTSCGTESDNWAIKSTAKAYRERGKHIISSPIEHPAVLNALDELSSDGYEIEYIKVGADGVIDLAHLKSIVRADTIMVICMFVNNEIGTIQPIKEVASIAKSVGAISFTDAVQATGVINYDVKELGVDMLSMSAHKFYGPKGVGALYVKNGVKLNPLLSGGHQERAKRGGTSNVAGAVGLAEALKIALTTVDEDAKNVASLRDAFVEGVKKQLPFIKVNGGGDKVPANANITFCGVNGESLLFNLDLKGICASNGSACSSGSIEPSKTLTEIGLTREEVRSTVRFTFGKHNTEEEVSYAIDAVVDCVKKLI